jgi:hypothetical protein
VRFGAACTNTNMQYLCLHHAVVLTLKSVSCLPGRTLADFTGISDMLGPGSSIDCILKSSLTNNEGTHFKERATPGLNSDSPASVRRRERRSYFAARRPACSRCDIRESNVGARVMGMESVPVLSSPL